MYPLTSNLSERRYNAYLLTINGSGCQTVFRAMFNLRNAVVHCFDPPHKVSPQDFVQRISEMESVMLMIGSTPRSYTLSHPAFSSYDADKQAFVVETLRLVTLVLLHTASHTVRPTATSHAKLDTTVQMALQHISSDEAWKVPFVGVWAWLSVGPFTSHRSIHEEMCCSRIAAMAPQINLALTYDNVRSFMLDLFYIPQLQDGCLHDLFTRINPQLDAFLQPVVTVDEPKWTIDPPELLLPTDPDPFALAIDEPDDLLQDEESVDMKFEPDTRPQKKRRHDET